MSSYTLFKPECCQIYQTAKRQHLIKAHKSDDPFMMGLKMGMAMAAEGSIPLTATDIRNNADSYRWWQDDCPTVFVDERLVKLIEKTKFSSTLIEDIHIPTGHQIISFSFPQGTTFNGIEISSCLFGFNDVHKSMNEALYLIGAPSLIPYFVDPLRQDESPRVRIVLPSRVNFNEPQCYLRGEFTSDDIREVSKDAGWLERTYGASLSDPRLPQFKWTHAESEKVASTLRLCVGLCVYMSAFPFALLPGLPEYTKKNQIGGRIQKKSHIWNLRAPRMKNTREGVEMHIRECHLRHLRHPRFKRDEHGRVRVIFIGTTTVGGTIEAHHVE